MRVLLLLLALGANAAHAEQVLRKGNAAEPETLDPHRAQGVNAANILRDLYEGLTAETPDGEVIPGAAERWTVSRDGKTYTFTLRANARWSNGDPVTAEDFVAGLRRSADPKTGSGYSQMLAPIENADAVIAGRMAPDQLGVRAVGARTLVIRLNAATPYLPGLLTHAITYPVHRPSLSEHGERFARPGALVSNGAYRLSEWVVQSHVSLTRNPHYWDNARTTIDRVVYVPTENQSSELKRYRAGELDWTDSLPINQLRWLRENMADEMSLTPYLGVYYYGFNLTQSPFQNNPALRKALALALDRETLTRAISGAGETPAYGWVPPGVANYEAVRPPWADWTREQRLQTARQLYADAGYSAARPLEFELRYNTSENHKKIAIAAAYLWKQALGVKVRLVNEEWKVYLQNRRHGKVTQMFCASWIGDYNDPYSFFELLHSKNGRNDTGYANPAYDALLERAAAEGDLVQRTALLQNAERLLLDDGPVLPVYFYVNKRVVSPRVSGWKPNIMDHHYTKYFRMHD